MDKVLIVLGIYLLAMVKFLVAMLAMIPVNLGFLPSVAVLVAGGMSGSLIMGLGEKVILNYFKKRNEHKIKKKKKTFTKFNKFLVWIKRKLGLIGIALLTPFILQVPIGTLMAVRLEKNFPKVMLYMFLSYTFWSCLVFGLYYGLGIKI